MKLGTKILSGVILTSALTTAAFAYGPGYNGNSNHGKSSCGMKSNHMMGKHKSGGHFMKIFRQLNLTDAQRKEIFEIRKEMMTKKATPDVAFTKSSFDKEKFISIMKQKRDNMIELRADMMEKTYKVLTSKQKEQLKVLMDLKKEKMQAHMDKRMNFDKNCNGRR